MGKYDPWISPQASEGQVINYVYLKRGSGLDTAAIREIANTHAEMGKQNTFTRTLFKLIKKLTIILNL